MLDRMLEGMLVLNLDLSIAIANRAAAQIFGYRPDELVGQPLTSLLQTPEQISIPSLHFPPRPAKSLTFVTGRHESLGRRKNGEIFPIELSVSQSIVEGESTLTILIRDLTEKRTLEQS
ncbi:MAG: PAS domain-containing protein, partial [Methylacidiphilaceae bacterium]|nr:PAS domain-containing protein [Candidatus Methylacidiphilaceae bacterium]